MQFLLDTNVLSSLIRDPQGVVARRIERVGEARICTTVVVAGELRFGARKKGSAALTAQMEAVLSPLTVLPLDPPVDHLYAAVRFQLEKAGTPIGANDLWIAAHALHLDCTLVTENEREFERVDGLRIENWLK